MGKHTIVVCDHIHEDGLNILKSTEDINYVYAADIDKTSLLDVIKRERPDYLAGCFDKGGSADRTEMFEDYKANRLETPEAIKIAVPYIEEILRAMHIPIMVKEGFEADDVIGTLKSKVISHKSKVKNEKTETIIVTGDKDLLQLVDDTTKVYLLRKGMSNFQLLIYVGIAHMDVVVMNC